MFTRCRCGTSTHGGRRVSDHFDGWSHYGDSAWRITANPVALWPVDGQQGITCPLAMYMLISDVHCAREHWASQARQHRGRARRPESSARSRAWTVSLDSRLQHRDSLRRHLGVRARASARCRARRGRCGLHDLDDALSAAQSSMERRRSERRCGCSRHRRASIDSDGRCSSAILCELRPMMQAKRWRFLHPFGVVMDLWGALSTGCAERQSRSLHPWLWSVTPSGC